MPDNRDNRSEGSDDAEAASVPTQPGAWRLVVFLAVMLLILLVVGVWIRTDRKEEAPASVANAASGESVVYLNIDAGRWRSDEEFFGWRDGMTVLDVLLLSGHKAEVVGSGGSAFVTAIGGVANDPSGGAGWQYSVGGERGKVGAGVRRLEPGDRVLWEHGPYE